MTHQSFGWAKRLDRDLGADLHHPSRGNLEIVGGIVGNTGKTYK